MLIKYLYKNFLDVYHFQNILAISILFMTFEILDFLVIF